MTKKLIFFLTVLFTISACEQDLQQPQFSYVLDNPTQSGSRYPHLYKDNKGVLYMSWLSHIEEDISALQYTTYRDQRWTEPKTVRINTDFFVNWADFPSVVGINGQELAAHRLKKVEGGPYAYDVQVSFYNEETDRWDAALTPHQDGTATEHGFVSLEPIDDERILAVWLDGRETEGRAEDEYSDTSKSMTIRSAEISISGEITNRRVIDDTVCDCCQTDLVKTDDGYLVVYRGRSGNEIRDIKIARYQTDTGTWTEPSTVHDDGWEIMACPVNGPRIVSNGNRVAVAWYTEADENPRVLMARSADGGNTFRDPIEIAGGEGRRIMGRTDLVMTNTGSVYVSWLQQDEEKGENGHVLLREVQPDGSLSGIRRIGTTASSRISGFPRIELVGNSIIFAWTQTQPLLRVRTAKVDI